MKRSLAVLAVLFLLLRPVCDVWAAAHGHAGPGAIVHTAAVADDHSAHGQSGEFCCAKVQDGNLIPASGVGLANAGPDGSLLVAARRSTSGLERFDRHVATRISDASPTRLSFYARSARIRR